MAEDKKVTTTEEKNEALEKRVSELNKIVEEKDTAIAEASKTNEALEAKIVSLGEAKAAAEQNSKIVPSDSFKTEDGGEYRFLNTNAKFVIPRMGEYNVEKALADKKAMKALILSESGMLETLEEPKKK